MPLFESSRWQRWQVTAPFAPEGTFQQDIGVMPGSRDEQPPTILVSTGSTFAETNEGGMQLCTRSQGLEEFLRTIDTFTSQHPDLKFVGELIVSEVGHAMETNLGNDELGTVLGRVVTRTFERLRHLLNPLGMELHLNKYGRIEAEMTEGVAVATMDVRGFTELCLNLQKLFGVSMLYFFSRMFFPRVLRAVGDARCYEISYTGDGLIYGSEDQHDKEGNLELKAIDNIVLCSIRAICMTNILARIMKRHGLQKSDGGMHEVGIGIAAGPMERGDVLVAEDEELVAPLRKLDNEFREACAEEIPWFDASRDPQRDIPIEGVHMMGMSTIEAVRAESLDARFKDHTCIIRTELRRQLCPPLDALFEPIAVCMLKGIGEAHMSGIRRFAHYDVDALEALCRAYYAEQRKNMEHTNAILPRSALPPDPAV